MASSHHLTHGHGDCGNGNCGSGGQCGGACVDGQLKLGLPHPILHAIAGPFLPRAIADPYQATVTPPHSKFHPVPTRPVFSPVSQFGPLSQTGPGYFLEAGPTLAIPPAGSSQIGPSQIGPSHVVPPSSPEPRPLDVQPDVETMQPELMSPDQHPALEPADVEPRTAVNSSTNFTHGDLLGYLPAHPAIKAVSADARFIER